MNVFIKDKLFQISAKIIVVVSRLYIVPKRYKKLIQSNSNDAQCQGHYPLG